MSSQAKPHKWRRRLLRTAIVLGVVALLLRIAVPLALPSILDSLAESGQCEASYEQLDFSVLTGQIELSHFSLRGKDSAGEEREALHAEYLIFDLDYSSILSGRPRVGRAEIDGLDVFIERTAAGQISTPFQTGAESSAAPQEQTLLATEEEADAGPEPLDSGEEIAAPLNLELPFVLAALRLQEVRVHFLDRSVSPARSYNLEAGVRVSDVGSRKRPARAELRLSVPGSLDALRMSAEIENSSELVNANIAAQMVGLHPGEFAHMLAPFGIAPHSDELAFKLSGNVFVRSGSEREPATKIDIGFGEIELSADGQTALLTEEFGAQIEFGSGPILIPAVKLRGMRAGAIRLENGAIRMAGLDWQALSSSAASEEPQPETSAAGGHPPAFVLDTFLIEDGELALRDESVQPAADLVAVLKSVSLNNLAYLPAALEQRAQLKGEFAAPGLIEKISIGGELIPFGPTRSAKLAVALEEFEFSAIQTYLDAAELELEPAAGPLSIGVDALLPPDAPGSLNVSMSWEHATFRDPSVQPPTQLGFQDLALELSDLPLGTPMQSSRAKIRCGLRSAGLIDSLLLVGEATIEPGELDLLLELEVQGRGIQTKALASYLTELGIESELREGSLSLQLESRARKVEEELELTAQLRDVNFRAGGRTAEPDLALGELRLESLRVGDSGLHIGEILVDAPSMRLARDAGGAANFARLRLNPSATSGEPKYEAPVAADSNPPQDLAVAPATAPTTTIVDAVRIQGARILWSDPGLATPLETELVASLLVEGVHTDGSRPAKFRAELSAGESLESLSVTGDFSLNPDDIRFAAKLNGAGIHGGELASYLPPGVELTLTDGSLALDLSGGLRAAQDGRSVAWFEASELNFADGDRALLAMRSATMQATLPVAGKSSYAIDEVALRGLELDARKTSASRIEVAGLALDSPAAGSQATQPGPLPSPDDQTQDPALDKPLNSPASEGDGVAAVQTRMKNNRAAELPRVTLETLDIGIDRFAFLDESQPGAQPLTLKIHLRNKQPLVLLDPEPAGLAPIELEVTGALEPVAEKLAVQLSLQPYLDRPEFKAEFDLTGIRGAGLTEFMPSLAASIDGEELQGGSAHADFDAVLNWRRRGPVDFDLAGGFGAEVSLQNVTFRAKPEGEVLAGLEGLFANIQNVNLSNGDVHVQSLELSKPILHARRDAAGLHVLGLHLKPSPAPEQEGGAETARDTQEQVLFPDAIEASVGTDEQLAAPSSEFRLDSLLIDGLDLLVLDESVTPPVRVPLNQLDVGVKGFTTRMLEEERALRFWVNLGAGDVPLPERTKRSFLGGLASSALKVTGMGEDESEAVERALFDEVGVTGRVSLYPAPAGWAKVELSALELQAFRGLANAAGVTIGDGVLDSRIDVRLLGESGVKTDAQFSFQYLSLDEPANGPISRYLKLPAPLDAVLFVLRNDDGEHVIPLKFEMSAEGGITAGEIAQVATTTLAKVIADAIASSPFRVLGSVTDMVGLTKEKSDDFAEDAVSVSFPRADTSLALDIREQLEDLLELLDDEDELTVVLQHELGTLDLARADILANPSPEDCRELAQRLRSKRDQLCVTRSAIVAESRAHYAIGREEEALASTERLRAIDTELGLTENSLDELYELMRPGAERRRDKRTREACLEIAARRLDSMRQFLLDSGLAADRIDSRRPRFEILEREQGAILLAPKKRP